MQYLHTDQTANTQAVGRSMSSADLVFIFLKYWTIPVPHYSVCTVVFPVSQRDTAVGFLSNVLLTPDCPSFEIVIRKTIKRV